ncbi:MAG: pinensin family lanthipeptide [Cyclobacteriaceae bacterium]
MKRKLSLDELEITSFVTAIQPEQSHLFAGGATGTCAGSGCAECKTLHGSGCMTNTCPEEEEPTVVDPVGAETTPG